MTIFTDFFTGANGLLPFIETLIIVILVITAFNFVLLLLKKHLLKGNYSKTQISNTKIFLRIVNIAFIIFVIIFAFLSYLKSWTGISVVLGLLTAALGFALQRPITSMAAWIMLVIKRPFKIGDRITIGDIKGDVYDITLTHVYIDEVGGLIDSEQHSGRNVMVPNYLLFEESIINHTLLHDYVLSEVVFEVTYESNIDKAMEIGYACAHELTHQYASTINKDARVRISLGQSGISIKVTFYAPVQQLSKIKSDITKKIYDRIMKERNIGFAYPHSEIILKGNKKNPYKKKR